MNSHERGRQIEVPLMSERRRRGLSLFLLSGSIFWLLLFTAGLIAMHSSPPTPPLLNNFLIGAVGLAGFGLFGWGSVAVRRQRAYLDGTTLHYFSGWWSGDRTADLARVTVALTRLDKRYGGVDLVLSGDGNLKKFPIGHPGPGVLPDQSREALVNVLATNPNQAAVNDAITLLRMTAAEIEDDSA